MRKLHICMRRWIFIGLVGLVGLVGLAGCAGPGRMSIPLPAVRIQKTSQPEPVFLDLDPVTGKLKTGK